MSDVDQGWRIDDGPDEDWDDESWKYDDLYPEEPDDPNCWHPRARWCAWCEPLVGRARRRTARRWRQERRRWRKIERHGNDRFWRARNPAHFDEAPF